MPRTHVRRRSGWSRLAGLGVVPLGLLLAAGPETGRFGQPSPGPAAAVPAAMSLALTTEAPRAAEAASRTAPSSTASSAGNGTTPRPSASGSAVTPTRTTGPASSSTSERSLGAKLRTGVDPSAPLGGPFTSASVWKQDVRRAPLAQDSREMVDNLRQQVADHYLGVASLNVWNYNASFYTVPADQPRVNVGFDDCQHKGHVPNGLLGRGGQFTGVPIPADAVPAPGADAALAIYQPSTDRLWEFWQARRNGRWSACWGGRIDHVSRSGGWFKRGFGQTATGLANAGGMIGIREAQAGRISHALALQIIAPATWTRVSWPAQRSDGYDTSPHAIPEGTRLRLDPSVNVDALRLHPLAKMIAKAAQTYGFIVTDKSGAVSVVTENGAAVKAKTGTDPWKRILGRTPSWSVLKNFPWDRLQALPKDYGRP